MHMTEPAIRQAALLTVHWPVSGTVCTVNREIAAPPSNAGAVHVTDTAPLWGVTCTLVGGSGVTRGVTVAVAALGVDSPATLPAITVKEYGLPLVRPVQLAVVSVTAHRPSLGAATTR